MLGDIEYDKEQIIVCPDAGTLYFDFSGLRAGASLLKSFIDDDDRVSAHNLPFGFYFVLSTSAIWKYTESGWEKVTEEKNHPIFFGPKDSFPKNALENILYIDLINNLAYRWDKEIKDYISIADSGYLDGQEWTQL